MIKKISVKKYKCLDEVSFRLGKLTLFTGTNSVGKSSFIQTLLLNRLALLARRDDLHVIALNGPFGLSLGTFTDMIRHETGLKSGSKIEIDIVSTQGSASLVLTSEAETQRFAHFVTKGKVPKNFDGRGLGYFSYLSAEREGPRDSSVLQSVPKEHLDIDFRGQSVANILFSCDRDAVRNGLEHPSAGNQRLLKQAEAWLSGFVPGVEIRVEPEGLDAISMRYKRGGVEAEWERPSNTGFGVSYCLPIVVAGLVARAGSLLIVDSPEAHLHPSAQSAMGAFLGQVAAADVQVIVETHSDHVLNGIRLAALDRKHPLNRTSVVINHLRQAEGRFSKEEIKIDARGSLSSRPPEFFDQAELDLARIVRRRFDRSED